MEATNGQETLWALGQCTQASSTRLDRTDAAGGQDRLDHPIPATVCTGLASAREPVAFHERLLAPVFSFYLLPLFRGGSRSDSYAFWHGIYYKLSGGIGYAKHYVHPLSLQVS